jgi:hypothetical protein
MTFRRIHTDQTAWFCIFRSDAGEHLLYAALRDAGWPEIAMRLTADETAMFRDCPANFLVLARDFIASHDSAVYSSRKISFRSHGADVIETV